MDNSESNILPEDAEKNEELQKNRFKNIQDLAEEREDLARKSLEKGDNDFALRLLEEARGLWYKLNLPERAAEMYEKFDMFTNATKIWEKLGRPEKVQEMTIKKEKQIKNLNKEQTEEKVTRRTSLTLALLSFMMSTFLFSQNMTGKVILKDSDYSFNGVGAIFFILSIVFIYIYAKKAKQNL